MGDAADRLFQLINGFRASHMVALVARHGIADRLADGPCSADELAEATGLHAGSLRRLLRALCTVEVFTEQEDGRFAGTELSEQLRDIPGSQRAWAIMLPEEGALAWADLEHSLRTGEPTFERAFGMDRWQHLAAHPEAASRFNAAMVAGSRRLGAAVAEAGRFIDGERLVDVGGGNGGLLLEILKWRPSLRGVIFDLPGGLEGARDRLRAEGLDGRCQLAEGSFFEAVPAGAEVYVMKNILHDWDDASCARMLERVAQAMTASSRLLVVERVLPERALSEPLHRRALMGDMQMMVVLGGRERSRSEYEALLGAASLRVAREAPLPEGFSALEARRA